MSSHGRKKIFAFIFMVLVLAVPFGIMYFISTDYYQNRYQQSQKNNKPAALPLQSVARDDQIFLLKNRKTEVDKTALVFKNYRNKTIYLEIYLLELDPLQPYPLEIKRKEAGQDLLLGDRYYQLISVNQRYLNIKRLQTFQSP